MLLKLKSDCAKVADEAYALDTFWATIASRAVSFVKHSPKRLSEIGFAVRARPYLSKQLAEKIPRGCDVMFCTAIVNWLMVC